MASAPDKPSDPDASAPTIPSDGDDLALARTSKAPRLPGDEASHLLPGTRLGGRYLIKRPLGVGGMGAVYLAVDEVLGTDVALKVVRSDLARSGRGVATLRDEVLLAQKVTHPNVCRIYDLEEVAGPSGSRGDQQYVVKMEYVAGETLSQRLVDGPLEVSDARRIARGIAAGLGAAHAEGVVHRDLKPQNVMVEEKTGRVVLMDFGLARSQRDGDDAEQAVSGTPEYMAPEQARGEKIDGRADLYALGALIYHLLVGKVPFPQARALARQGRPITGAAPDPRAHRPDLPPWFSRLILRLLEKDPARRYRSAREVEVALAGPPYRRWAIGGVVVVAAAALLANSLYLSRRARPEWRAHLRELPAWDENADMPSFSPDGTKLAYLSDRDGDWRIYVEPLAGGPSRPVTPPLHEGVALDPDVPRWSRDGKTILFVSAQDRAWRIALDGSPPVQIADKVVQADECGEGALALVRTSSPGCPACQQLVLRAQGGGERELLQLPSHSTIDFLRCDPAGRQIVYTRTPINAHAVQRPGDIWVLSVDGGPPRKLTDEQQKNRYPAYPAFVPDGRSVVFSSARAGTTNLWEVSVAGGAPVPITTGEGPDLAPSVSPDGKLLVFDDDVTAVPIFALPLDGAGRRRRIAPTLDDVAGVLSTPDGRELIAGVRKGARRAIVAIPLDGGEERPIVDGETPALSADGQEVIFSRAEGARTLLLAVPRAGGTARPLAEVPGLVTHLAVGPDGILHLARRLDRGLEASRVAPGGAVGIDAPSPYMQVIPAPRGGWRLAIAMSGDTVRTAHIVPPGRAVDDPQARTVPERLVTWEPSGESFVYWDGAALHRFHVATGTSDLLAPAEKDLAGLAVSPDGKTLYFTSAVGHVRRHLIDNFADRPRVTAKR